MNRLNLHEENIKEHYDKQGDGITAMNVYEISFFIENEQRSKIDEENKNKIK